MPETTPEPSTRARARPARAHFGGTRLAPHPPRHSLSWELPPFVEPPVPWESGEFPDEGRLPGTRRLWMAGGLAVAVLIATATAIAVLDSNTHAASKNRANHTASDTGVPLIPGFSALAEGSTTAPAGKNALSSPRHSGSTSTASDSASPGSRNRGPTTSRSPAPPSRRRPPRPASLPSPSPSPRGSRSSRSTTRTATGI